MNRQRRSLELIVNQEAEDPGSTSCFVVNWLGKLEPMLKCL